MDMPKKIMIVEDETITQRYLKNILEQYDVSILDCYDNAKDAQKAIKETDYDMILMDINIKGATDGIQLAREILKTHSVPIVFITAHNDNETFEEVLELSPYGFISKPFSAKDVELSVQLAHKRFISYHKSAEFKNTQIALEKIVISPTYIYSCTEHKLYQNNTLVKLNIKQNKLLNILSENINSVVHYDTIILMIWGDETIADSALRTLVYTIRKALPDLPIISHSKLGYSLSTNLNG